MLLSAANNNLDDRGLSTAFYVGYGPAETHDTCHVLPMTRNNPSVRCAVAATAACHLENRLDDDQLKRQSLYLRLKATELLTAGLNSDPDGPDLACMLLLAQLDVRITYGSVCGAFLTAVEVCSGDCVEFETHLKAASTFIKLRGSDSTERGFIEQRIAW